MRKTRQSTILHIEKVEKRRLERETLTPVIRAERLATTKRVAEKIISTQESFGDTKRGCRKHILDIEKQLHSWLSKKQVDWHIIQIRKKRKKKNLI